MNMLNPFRKKLPANDEALRDISAAHQTLQAKTRKRLSALQAKIEQPTVGLVQDVNDAMDYAALTTDAMARLQQMLSADMTSPVSIRAENPKFVLSTHLLQNAVHYLIGDGQKRERMVLVAGVVIDDTVVFTETLSIPTKEQSAAYVKADPGPTARMIDDLASQDHQLWAMWHSHIMTGKQSTRPSQTDIANQNRMVAFGMSQMLGGIANLDGWFRMFSTATDFELALYGTGPVEIVDDHPREKILKVELKDHAHGTPLSQSPNATR